MIKCKADEKKSILIKPITEDSNTIGIIVNDQHYNVSLSVYLSLNDCHLLQSKIQEQMNILYQRSRYI